jgi:hypothetical protein
MDFQITPIQNPNMPTEMPIKPSFIFVHKMKFIIGIVAILIAFAAYFLFSSRSSFNENQISFKIDGSKEITSGQLVSYTINYENNSKVGVVNAKIDFVYPPDSVPIKDGNVIDSNNENIVLGDLASGEKGQKVLTAYVIGDRGNIKTARGTISYNVSTISSSFEKEVSVPSTITTLAIPLTLVAPPSTISGQNISYLVDYRNQSQQDYTDLRISLKYPDGFKFNTATPQPTTGQSTWDLTTLKQGDGSRITIQGTLTGGERDSKNVSLILQKKITTPSGDVYVDFEKTDASSVISSPYITVKLQLNNSTNYTAHLSDNLSYTVTFANASSVDITGLTLTVKLEGQMFEFSSVQSPAFFDSRTNTLTWDQSLIPELGLLRPNQRGTTQFSVNLKSSFSGSGSSIASSIVKASAHLETPNIPQDLDSEKLSTDDQIVTKISSAPVFSQQISINNPQFGSNGPFPPKVDSTTKFTVHWTLVNPANNMSPAKVSATLAPGIKWENLVISGSNQPLPTYNTKTGIITWDLSLLPAGSGISLPKYETYFQISITPSVNQVGQTPTLLRSVKFDGTDTSTQEKITRTVVDPLTSSVIDSNLGGAVQAK